MPDPSAPPVAARPAWPLRCLFLAAFCDLGLLAAAATTAAAPAGWIAAIVLGPAILASLLPAGGIPGRPGAAVPARVAMAVNLGATLLGALGLWLGSPPALLTGLLATAIVWALLAPACLAALVTPGGARRLPEDAALALATMLGPVVLLIVLGLVGAAAAELAGAAPGPGTARAGCALVLAVAAALGAAWGPRGGPGGIAPPPGAGTAMLPVRAGPVLAHAWFWVGGAVAFGVLVPLLARLPDVTRGDPGLCVCLGLLGLFGGIAAAVFLGGGRIVLLGGAIGSLLLALALVGGWMLDGPRAPAPVRLGLDLLLAGFGLGLTGVPPLAAVLATAALPGRAPILGRLGLVAGAGLALVAALFWGADRVGLSEPARLGIAALASLAVAVAMLARLSPNPAGELVWMLFRLAYRVELRGLEHLPPPGTPVIVTPNHVSWLDASLMFAVLDRPVFAIDGGVSRLWFVRPFLRVVEAVPVDAAHPLSMRRIIGTIRSGRPTVIFPEGRITTTGSMMRVQDGAAMAADKAGALLVPARIEGLQATPFSRLTAAQVRHRLFPRVRLTLLAPRMLGVRSELSGRRRREAAAWALQDMMGGMMLATADTGIGIFEAVARGGREHGMGRLAVQDPIRGPMSYRKLLAGAAVLGAKLAPHASPEGRIGLMLPNANAAAASLLGLLSAGVVPVMLNPRAGLLALQAAVTATGFTTLATSRALVERLRLEATIEALSQGVSILYLEDLHVGRMDRVRGLLRGGRPLAAVDPDAPAVVLMTSGTSGLPKAVLLSHRNILSNVAQAAAVIDFGPADRLLNVLPLFHSFGLTAGLVLPLVHGMSIFLYPSPIDYRAIPLVASRIGATVLFGTNSFLTGYARMAHPADFLTLRLVVAGAEAVTSWTRQIWSEKFGLRILEGYGVTETAPVLAFNTPLSNRYGTVGRLVPGIEARLVAMEGITQGGRLQVAGPNIMLGYFRVERPGVLEPPLGGWYDTGDIATISAVDGHVTIRGRAARFAKIAGEMVSLALIEQLAADLWQGALVVAVAIADPRKGERVLLATDWPTATRSDFLVHARAAHLPEVAFPAEVRIVSSMPLLGSGKPDIVQATRLAAAGELGVRAP